MLQHAGNDINPKGLNRKKELEKKIKSVNALQPLAVEQVAKQQRGMRTQRKHLQSVSGGESLPQQSFKLAVTQLQLV